MAAEEDVGRGADRQRARAVDGSRPGGREQLGEEDCGVLIVGGELGLLAQLAVLLLEVPALLVGGEKFSVVAVSSKKKI